MTEATRLPRRFQRRGTDSVIAAGIPRPDEICAAKAPDGVIEAVEALDPAWWMVAVQWHPEDSAAEDQQQQNLFDALIKSVK